MSDEQIKLALLEEARELVHKEKLTLELFEILDARMVWLIRFCRKNGIEIPNQEALIRDEQRIKRLMGELSGEAPEVKHPRKSPDDESESIFLPLRRSSWIVRESSLRGAATGAELGAQQHGCSTTSAEDEVRPRGRGLLGPSGWPGGVR